MFPTNNNIVKDDFVEWLLHINICVFPSVQSPSLSLILN